MAVGIGAQPPAQYPRGFNQDYRGDQDLLNTLINTDQENLLRALTLNSHILAKGNPSLTDRMWMEDRIRQAMGADERRGQLKNARMAEEAGLMQAPNLSGAWVARPKTQTSASRGAGISQPQIATQKGSNMDIARVQQARQGSSYNDRREQEKMFQDQLRREAMSAQQDQKLKMQFLNEIMKKFGGRGDRETVMTEQIFNNAGAPLKVPIRTTKQGNNNDMLMQLLRGVL